MKKIISFCIIIIFALSFTFCSEEPTVHRVIEPYPDEPEPVPNDDINLVIHGNITEAQSNAILNSLNNNYDRILADLNVTSMPPVTVAVWSQNNTEDFYYQMNISLGQVYPGATGYTPSLTEMRMLHQANTPTVAVHEFAHLVSMELNPTISNNPRWLWEAVAQYESSMFDHPSTWPSNSLNWPGFNTLNSFNIDAPYRWGYFIGAFIIENWGHDAYVRLIETNGNITSVLGITAAQFGEQTEQYVRGLIN